MLLIYRRMVTITTARNYNTQPEHYRQSWIVAGALAHAKSDYLCVYM